MKINEYNCAVKHFLENDVVIHNLMSQFKPIEMKVKRNYFKALTKSIIGQQLSVASAKAIVKKFNSHFGKELSPLKIRRTREKTLRMLGLSNAKTKYVKDLANKILTKEINLRGISNKSNFEIMDELTKVKGIGTWTVHMFLIFVLGRKDVLPEGDLGIKKAIMLNYNLKNLPTGEEVIKISKINNWAPYNSYASLYLWLSIDGN